MGLGCGGRSAAREKSRGDEEEAGGAEHSGMKARARDRASPEWIFDQLHARRDEIEKAFGNPLSWERLDAKRACRLNYRIDLGGYRSPEIQWPQIHDAMIRTMSRLEAVLVPVLTSLGL